MLLITPLGSAQSQKYAQLLETAKNAASVAPVAASVVEVATLPEPSRDELIDRFARESKMKRPWAHKCLEDNQWDFDKAAAVFAQIRDKVPADAFQ